MNDLDKASVLAGLCIICFLLACLLEYGPSLWRRLHLTRCRRAMSHPPADVLRRDMPHNTARYRAPSGSNSRICPTCGAPID